MPCSRLFQGIRAGYPPIPDINTGHKKSPAFAKKRGSSASHDGLTEQEGQGGQSLQADRETGRQRGVLGERARQRHIQIQDLVYRLP